MPYAQGTKVPVEQSIMEIRKLVYKHGGEGFAQMDTKDGAAVVFELRGYRLRMLIRYPTIQHIKNTSYYSLTDSEAKPKREQRIRELWRLLLLAIKTKLELTEHSDIVTFEGEWLSYITLPDGATVGEVMLPELQEIAKSGNLPPLLPAPRDRGN